MLFRSPKDVLLKNDDQYYLQRSLRRVYGIASSNSCGNDGLVGSKFRIRSIWNWWKQHSLLPLVLNYLQLGVDSSVSVGIRAIREEFQYYTATVVKHFKRDARSWETNDLGQRLLRIQEAKTAICRRWPSDCLPPS